MVIKKQLQATISVATMMGVICGDVHGSRQISITQRINAKNMMMVAMRDTRISLAVGAVFILVVLLG
jgi:hypothetical protein